MKKAYFTTLAVALAVGGAQAQQNTPTALQTKVKLEPARNVQMAPARPIAQHTDRDDATPIFFEDFANGFEGNNGVGEWTTAGPNGDVWKRTTTGPRGAYSQTSEAIGAPASVSNGWAMFNSDSANADWTNPNNPTMISNPVSLVGSLVSPVLDLSADTDVEIRFYQKFRYCCASLRDNDSNHMLEVSTDGGNTWPAANRFKLEPEGVEANDDFGTYSMRFKLSGIIAGGATQVRFRFTHDGTIMSSGTQGTSHYHWQIDDVGIYRVPDHELGLHHGLMTQDVAAYDNGWTQAYRFHRMTAEQMLDEIQFMGNIYNYGLEPQTNVIATMNLTDATGTELASTTQSLNTLSENDTAQLSTSLSIPYPLDEGMYTVNLSVTSDEIDADDDPTNNSIVQKFEITDAIGLDALGILNNNDLIIDAGGTNSWTDYVTDVRLLNAVVINEPQTFTGVEVYLYRGSSSSDPDDTQTGSYFIGSLYGLTAGGDDIDLDNPIAQTDLRIITSTDRNNRIVYAEFLDPITLDQGEFGEYFVSANLYREAGKNIAIVDDRTVHQPTSASMLWHPSDATLYINGNAWAIRLVSRIIDGIQENPSLEGVTIYPSPTEGPFNVVLDTPGRMDVEVFNVLGELVHTSSFQGSRTTVDLSGQAAGIYTVRVSDGERSNVQRISLR